MDKCYYEILEIEREATQDQIQKSFRKLVKMWHPDICNHPSAESKIKEINEAYDTLKDTEKRKSYNIQRGYALNKNTAKENFKYKYDYKSGSFNKEKSEKSSEFKRAKEDVNENSKNGKTFSRENYDLIYNVIKKYVAETQIKIESIKFPNINFVKIVDKSGIFFVEGHFTSLNWVGQTIETTYLAKVTSQFKLLSMDFLSTKEVFEQASNKKQTNKKQSNKKSFKAKEKRLDSSEKFRLIIVIIFILVLGIVKLNEYFRTPSQNLNSFVVSSEETPKTNRFSQYKNPYDKVPTQEDLYMKKVISKLKDSMDYDNPVTRKFYLSLAAESPGTYNIGQISTIYSYLYGHWKYVNDPLGRDYFAKASESIESNLAGDCDDFAILMATCIQGIGGESRIVFAENNSGKHAYAEVKIANNERVTSQVIDGMRAVYQNNIGTIHYKNSSNGEVWLNLDWNGATPGSKYFDSDREWIFDMRNNTFSYSENK